MAMTKAEIIEQVVNDMSRSRSAFGNSSVDVAGYSEKEMVATLPGSLQKLPPYAMVRVCADFGDPDVECCEACHYHHPHSEMDLIDVEGGGNAGICCSLDRVLNPLKHDRIRNSPEYQEIERMFNGDVAD